MTKVTSELIERYRTGDPITNQELDALINHMNNLSDLLRPFGESYGLVKNDVFRILDRLQGYKFNREYILNNA